MTVALLALVVVLAVAVVVLAVPALRPGSVLAPSD